MLVLSTEFVKILMRQMQTAYSYNQTRRIVGILNREQFRSAIVFDKVYIIISATMHASNL